MNCHIKVHSKKNKLNYKLLKQWAQNHEKCPEIKLFCVYKFMLKCYCEHKSKVNHKTGKFSAKVILDLNQSLNVFKF